MSSNTKLIQTDFIDLINVPFPAFRTDADGIVMQYNNLAKGIFGIKDELQGKNLFDLLTVNTSIAITKEFLTSKNGQPQFINFEFGEKANHNPKLNFYIFPKKSSKNGLLEYIFFILSANQKADKTSIGRYLHYLTTINKISSMSYRYNDIDILSQFVVSQLFNEEYNFFHVAIFLRENNFRSDHVYLCAVAGESRELFLKNQKKVYRQSLKQGVLGEVIRKGKSIIVDNTEEIVFYHSTPYFKGKSELCVPIYLVDQVIGAINIESKQLTHFDEADVSFLQTISDLFAANVHRTMTNNEISQKNIKLEKYLSDLEKAKDRLELQSAKLKSSLEKVKEARLVIEKQNALMQNKLEMGAELQKSLLPISFPEIPDLHFNSKYLPTSQLGGDFFDVVSINEDHIGVIIADVSGHGVSAAMIAAMFKALYNNFKQQSHSAADVLNYLNGEFSHMLNTGDFISAFYMIINTRDFSVEYANAAHPFPMIYRSNSSIVEELDTKGFFIGVFKSANYQTKKTFFQPGDKILFYTDGTTEVKNDVKKQFGRNRLREHFGLISRANKSSKDLIDSIYTEIVRFSNKQDFEDDLTLLLLERSF